MPIVVKKISKGALISFVSLGGFFAIIILKMFFGGANDNLARFENKAKDVLSDCCHLSSTAKADSPDLPIGCSY
ncbi:MAG: hypothetical protein V1814_01235 [Candidatus Moraniibacteriota bacterium]